MAAKTIAILGSTGSIGTQTLDVIRNNPDKFRVQGLACGENIEVLVKQIMEFRPKAVSVASESGADQLRKLLSEEASLDRIEIFYGEDGLNRIASLGAEILVNSLMGIKGLLPTIKGIEVGSDIALANKETLVAGGEIVMKKARERGVKILPIDSEHSAIFQCLEAENLKREMWGANAPIIKRILLTASGGPFRGWKKEDLFDVTPEMALKHPNWEMGKKITIDSATMMNKGLEVIEAMHLFDVDASMIEVLIHPQSIVHSGVEFQDGAVLAQMGTPDMRTPISIALGYPERLSGTGESLDLIKSGGELTFEEPDMETFRCLDIAIKAAKTGGLVPAVMNGSNEVLVESFLNERVGFMEIPEVLERVIHEFESELSFTKTADSVEDVLDADRWARLRTEVIIKDKGGKL